MPQGTESVLLVEDEPNVRKISSTVLRGLGYDVVEATCGEEALRVIQQGKLKAIDLLVTDVIMPEMNGKELADQVLLSHPETKVLFISGYTADAIDQHGISDESLNLLQKPFTASILAAKIREVLDGHATPVLRH
jgi:CheY-like chemotaxis protein